MTVVTPITAEIYLQDDTWRWRITFIDGTTSSDTWTWPLPERPDETDLAKAVVLIGQQHSTTIDEGAVAVDLPRLRAVWVCPVCGLLGLAGIRNNDNSKTHK